MLLVSGEPDPWGVVRGVIGQDISVRDTPLPSTPLALPGVVLTFIFHGINGISI